MLPGFQVLILIPYVAGERGVGGLEVFGQGMHAAHCSPPRHEQLLVPVLCGGDSARGLFEDDNDVVFPVAVILIACPDNFDAGPGPRRYRRRSRNTTLDEVVDPFQFSLNQAKLTVRERNYLEYIRLASLLVFKDEALKRPEFVEVGGVKSVQFRCLLKDVIAVSDKNVFGTFIHDMLSLMSAGFIGTEISY